MPYRIKRDESVTRAVRRAVRDELDGALRAALDSRRTLDERVHDARVGLKRARAALALVAGQVGRPAKRDARALGALGRALAAPRDRAVARELVTSLAAALARTDAPKARRGRAAFVARLRRRIGGDEGEGLLREVVRRLARVRRTAGPWKVARGRRAVVDGFARAYRRARRGLARVQAHEDAARFHAWRKAVKRLGYQTALLGEAAPKVVAPLEPLLDRLGKQLGELHDLSFLADILAEVGDDPALPGEGRRWRAVVEERCRVLRGETRTLGAALFAERPSALRRRLDEAWRDV